MSTARGTPPEIVQEPCPERIVDGAGASFGLGAAVGYVYHFLRGLCHSHKGGRLRGGAQAVRMNAPRLGGSFAAWGGLFSTFDCAMVYARRKEDPWNSILAGAFTSGFLRLRHGPASASRYALASGAFLLQRVDVADPQNLPAAVE